MPFSMAKNQLAQNHPPPTMPPKAKAIIDKYKGEYFSRYWAEKLDVHVDEIMDRISKDPKHKVYMPNAEEMKQWKALMEPVVASWDKVNDRWDKLFPVYREGIAKVRAVRRGACSVDWKY